MWTLRKRLNATNSKPGEAINDVPSAPASSRARSAGRGQSLLEMALVLPMFLMLLCAIVDFSHVFYVEMTVQDALREAGRFAITGNTLSGQSRLASILATAQQAAGSLNINTNSINITSNGTGGTGAAANAGGPGDIITISMSSGVPMLTPLIAPLFPNGAYNFTVSVTFKNEPFTAAGG
jgi:Flp pilus assembly protein TadG